MHRFPANWKDPIGVSPKSYVRWLANPRLRPGPKLALPPKDAIEILNVPLHRWADPRASERMLDLLALKVSYAETAKTLTKEFPRFKYNKSIVSARLARLREAWKSRPSDSGNK